MRIMKSKKALSPVVASIILIAVTVAVSIAVAAWMGALTFTFTATEQIQITDLDFTTTDHINVTIRNTGTSPVTINEALVNGDEPTSTDPDLTTTTLTVDANAVEYLDIGFTWANGGNYEVKLGSSKGNAFMRTESAPA